MRTVVSTAVLFLVAPQAFADGFGVVGFGGFETIEVKHDEKMDHSGFQGGVIGQYSLTEATLVDLTLGAGIKYSRLVGEMSKMDLEATISQPIAAFEAGLGGHVVPDAIYLQGTLGYDVGFAGTDTVKVGGSSKKYDLEKYGQWVGNLRAFYRVLPAFDVGVQLSGEQGALRAESADDDSHTMGYGAALALRSNF